MNVPRPGGRPPDPDFCADRQRLAALIGRLLARRWHRERRAARAGEHSHHPNRPRGVPLRPNPGAG